MPIRPKDDDITEAKSIYDRCIELGTPIPERPLRTLIRHEILKQCRDGETRVFTDGTYRWDAARLRWIKTDGC